ncbi:MAG: hypothetical protein WBA55_07775 [Allopontixanthobacter sediminis]
MVLSDESARHPFLASLPPHVRKGIDPGPARPRWVISREDVRGFFGAYIACLLAVMIFIA